MRLLGFALLVVAGCGGSPTDKAGAGGAGASSGTDGASADSAPPAGHDSGEEPCDCDDGLWCNGEEACAEDGSCVEGVAPEPVDDGDPCTVAGACDEDADRFPVEAVTGAPACEAAPPVPTVGLGDHSWWYWPANHRPVESWPVVEREMHVLTGHYGLAFDEESGQLTRLGAFSLPLASDEAEVAENGLIEGFPAASLSLGAGPEDARVWADDFDGVTPSSVDKAMMIDGGRFLNRLHIPSVGYTDPGLAGSFTLTSMPRHLVLTHALGEGGTAAHVLLGGEAVSSLTERTWLVPERVLRATDESGAGWLFVAQDDGDSVGSLAVDAAGTLVATGSAGTISLLAAPTAALGPDEEAMYLDPLSVVQVRTQLLDREGVPVGESDAAVWDPVLGAFRADLRPQQETGAPRHPDWESAEYHNWYGRHQVTLDAGGRELSVPLALHGPDTLSWYITGGAFLFRDENGEPNGLPIQVSKNWHGEYWYHLATQPTLHGADPTTMELTVASSRWGTAYAASHAQLSLVGWSDAGGHWDESALGAFGESITYDPDQTLQRAMLDDVRPFLVDAGRKWSWTGNVGGADFLRLVTSDAPGLSRRVGRVRSHYRALGPALTDVAYTGRSSDGSMLTTARTFLSATDDLVRLVIHLRAEFLADVDYERLAFFQVAADNYGDNGFARYALGDATGVVQEGAVPNHGSTGYESDDWRGLPLMGAAPWVLLYDNQRDWDSLPEHHADVGFVVRDFRADIGGTTLTTPHVNVHRTRNGQSQYAFELGLPHEEGSPWCGDPCEGKTRFVPAGSVVEAVVEYLVLPAEAERYYGASDHLLALDPAVFGTPALMQHLAAGNALSVSVETGRLVHAAPPTVEAAWGALAAELVLDGGLGHTPITVRGLPRPDGWVLEREGAEGFVAVEGAVHGNDHWQTVYDSDQGTWTLTTPVQNRGSHRYRLRWAGAED